MLVINHAARLIQHLPSALPSHETEVGVFQIERLQQRIEAAQLEKFLAIECARAAAAIEAGEEIGHRIVDAMTHAQAAVFPPALREPTLFAQLRRIAEEDLAGDGEDIGIAKPFEQRRQKIGRDAHVAVEQNDDGVRRGLEARIRTAAESKVARQRYQLDLREVRAHEIGRAIG